MGITLWSNLCQLAKLSTNDMKAVKNMKLIEGSENRKTSGGFSLKFDSMEHMKHEARKDRTGEEETWQLFASYLLIFREEEAW
ncbi:unnamed protein product [Coffea canephora]|uniref:DH200=94 genomic scaffold, scaffold_1082 n=1 Tax=Coffea canephora TaxID=49390 RepID=A0A068VIA3_COFCA|nr:unnamed protein product [Coffea canephora]